MKRTLIAVLAAIGPAGASFAQSAPSSYDGDPSVYKVIYEDANFRLISANRPAGVKDKAHGHPCQALYIT